MTSQPDLQSSQPPRIASWLLTLFTPAEVAEPIMGDLFEEFSGLVLKSDIGFARNWYWRQTLKTILYTGGDAFRAAPWLMFVTIAGGLWLIGFATRSSLHAMQIFLNSHRIYELHPSAYVFWSKFPLELGRVIICGLAGVVVALAAKRGEMAAVIVISLVQIALFLAAVVAVIARGEAWFHWFMAMLLWNSLGSAATVLGGAAVRIYRSATTNGPSVT